MNPDHAVSYDCVFHVGDLSSDRVSPHYSQEGDGLSVSTHPADWASIANLGSHAYGLVKSESLFYDAALDAPRDVVHEWCTDNGYVREVDGYRMYYDAPDAATEDDTRYMEFYTREEARSQADAPEYNNSRVEAVTSIALDTAGRAYWNRAFTSNPDDVSPIEIRGLMPVWYAENTSAAEYDGVWWHNTYDPRNYSAPRGVIFQSKLDEWTIAWEGDVHSIPLPDELLHAVETGAEWVDADQTAANVHNADL